MPDDKMPLADRIRRKLDGGLLPRVLPYKMWTGYGHNDPCDGCGEAIYPAQIEYHFKAHVGSSKAFQFHIGCVGMWVAELRRRGLAKETGSD